ncbi:hypothetical protein [Phenylobacterium sp.]|uniref:DUF6894 family protein n=1 Tax=Phenylobacterium sp. TaxID=1871053 RepID=UPI003523843A
MARFFFHTENGAVRLDTDGVELASEDAAGLEATGLLGALLADSPRGFWDSRRLTVTVADADGQTLFTVEARTRRHVPSN